MSDLELVVPFYEGLRFRPAVHALRSAKSQFLDLAYPGPLSMPFIAWRCGQGAWTAILVAEPETVAASLSIRASGDELDARLECFGACAFEEIHADGDWRAVASAAARRWVIPSAAPPLSAAWDRYHFFVRQWVSNDGEPLRTDWTAPALLAQMGREQPRTIAFVYGLDPHEVDLEGRYFWSEGALDEVRRLVRANPDVAQFHWLNLRSYKYAIPKLGIDRPPSAEVLAAAKQYADGVHDFSQYVFSAVEMCLGAEPWQRSRIEELDKLIGLGFRVIAYDEFPASPKWDAQACHASDHLHRANDFGDEQRVVRGFLRRLSERARHGGVALSSEEPSAMLLPFTSGYMDCTFNDPTDMYEHWARAEGVERIPLFSAMFGDQVTPYTRPVAPTNVPGEWMVQKKISSPP